ncbi:MAG: hypothetical protein J6A20_08220 [Muribaculaceae bacterium]|nr:hypothetical protein [Muribaculaceae bacterium]
MKNKVPTSSVSQILVYSCSAIVILLLLFTWYEVQFNTPNVWTMLSETELTKKFPLSENTRDELIENSDIHFKYHNSLITVLSVTIASLGVMLTFAAFYIQYLFNARQKEDLSKERFENQYFHLLDVLRDICQNIYVLNVGKGKIAFHYMFYEYKAIYNMVVRKGILKDNDPASINSFSFKIFIDGVSPGFIPEFNESIINKANLNSFIEHLLDKQSQSENNGINGISDSGVRYIMDYRGKRIKYFDGHRLRLVHYFNYMLLILKYITENEIEDDGKELNMMDYLRGELTEHEMGLFYAYIKCYEDKCSNESIRRVERLLDTSLIVNKYKFDNSKFIPHY